MPEDPSSPTDKIVFGDTNGRLGGVAVAAKQDLPIQGSSTEGSLTLVGDAGVLAGSAQGGDDDLFAHGFVVRAFGDAYVLTSFAQGGDDVVSANSFSSSVAYGDAERIAGHAVGGDDQVSASSTTNATAYGDAALITGWGRGGDDTLSGGTSIHGVLEMFGDARRLDGHSVGGDDVLRAPLSGSTMWGDAAEVGPLATTGADLFIISFGNLFGQSIIDFEPGKDVVELVGYGVYSFEALASHFVAGSAGVDLDFGPTDSIFLAGVTVSQLSQRDFLLA